MKQRRRILGRRHLPSLAALTLAAAIAASGCGDDAETSPGASGAGGAATSAGSGSADLKPPVLLEVAPFALALKITWETPSASCASIEGERRTASADYAPVFETPGTDTVYVDKEATADQTYTYRLRCKLGGAVSAYSNEKTGNPMKF